MNDTPKGADNTLKGRYDDATARAEEQSWLMREFIEEKEPIAPDLKNLKELSKGEESERILAERLNKLAKTIAPHGK
jgi:hypothetical protein